MYVYGIYLKGDYPVDYYNCEAAATLTATFQLEMYKDNFTIWAYALVQSQHYSSLITSGNGVNNMKVIAKDEKTVLREINFEAPFRQVVNNYHHDLEQFRQDAVYILLSNNKIIKIKQTDLEDDTVSNFNLTQRTFDEVTEGNVLAFDAKLGKVALVDTGDNLIIINENS